jgi:hypothetical protein
MYQDTEQFLKFIHQPGTLIELRAQMPDNYFRSGKYTDPHKMAVHAAALQSKYGAKAVYYSLNSLKPEAIKIGCNEPNQFQKRAGRDCCAHDSDILHRAHYLIDVDPVRPSGVCSTASEKVEACAVAHQVQAYLTKHGWPEPIKIDSGNGIHLLYRSEHAINPDSAAWTYLLKALAEKFDTEAAKVDTTVFNPARISRLPGTMNCKGPNTHLRPHRRAQALSYPAKWEPVVAGQMVHGLAVENGFSLDAAEKIHAGVKADEEQVMDLIEEYPEYLHHDHTYTSGDRTIIALEECPFVGRRHSGGDSAFIIQADGAVGYKCFAESCPGEGFGSLLRLLKERTGRPSKAFAPTDVELTPKMYAAWRMTGDYIEDDPETLPDSPAIIARYAELEAAAAIVMAPYAPPSKLDPPGWPPVSAADTFRAQMASFCARAEAGLIPGYNRETALATA